MVLVACSAQNIDRVVTIYRAAKQTGRTLIVDAYAAEVLKATGNDSIPKPVRGWSNIAVFIPQAQRVHLVRKNIAPIVDSYRGFRLWPEQLAEQAPRSVMLFGAGCSAISNVLEHLAGHLVAMGGTPLFLIRITRQSTKFPRYPTQCARRMISKNGSYASRY